MLISSWILPKKKSITLLCTSRECFFFCLYVPKSRVFTFSCIGQEYGEGDKKNLVIKQRERPDVILFCTVFIYRRSSRGEVLWVVAAGFCAIYHLSCVERIIRCFYLATNEFCSVRGGYRILV